MRVILESEGQDAFILEESEQGFYLLDRRARRRFGPAPRVRFTRQGHWRPFGGDEEMVLAIFERAESAPLG